METIAKQMSLGTNLRFLGFLFFWVLMLGVPLTAQTLLGTWQGTLPIQQDPRIVLTIRQAADGPLAGSITFIDHDDVAAPLRSIVFASSELRLAVGDITYSGRIGADGKSLQGIWTRGTQKYPLTFALATPETAWTYSGPARLVPMSSTADPVFEVATVKPSNPDAKHTAIETRYRLFKAENSTVFGLIRFAYHLTARQVQGGPAWMKELRFDIVGEPDLGGLPSLEQHRSMVRKLLAERFHLTAHDIQHTFPVYVLTAPKPHMKVTPIAPNDLGETKILVTDLPDGTTNVQFVYTTIPQLEDTLMAFIQDRQIVDKTGLSGQFNIILTVPSEVFKNSSIDEGERRAAFFKAVQAVGFQLTPEEEPLQVVVIDHLEQPTQN